MTCFSCLGKYNRNVIVGGCSVVKGEKFPSGALSVNILVAAYPSSKLVVTSFTENSNSSSSPRVFSGYGDVTCRKFCNMFVFASLINEESGRGSLKPSPNTDIAYLEYSNQEHCLEVRNQSSAENNDVRGVPHKLENLTIRTRSPVRLKLIRCEKNVLRKNDVKAALRAYRTIDLETLFPVNKSMTSKCLFNRITPDDVYRAIYARLLSTSVLRNGTFYEYTECAFYKWRYMAPLIACGLTVFVLALVAIIIRIKTKCASVPFSTHAWFEEAVRKRKDEEMKDATEFRRNSLRFRRTQSAAAKVFDPDGNSFLWRMSTANYEQEQDLPDSGNRRYDFTINSDFDNETLHITESQSGVELDLSDVVDNSGSTSEKQVIKYVSTTKFG